MYNILSIVQELLNKQRLTLNLTITATLAIISATAMTTTNNVWAADINCPNLPPIDNFLNCEGTEDPDNMQGTSKPDFMKGFNGDDNMNGFAGNDAINGGDDDDTMNGGSGHDTMFGSSGDDKINGDSGNDILFGALGADILKGSSGNDQIYHFVGGASATGPDRSRDEIDCGSGIDEAWINTSTDRDTAVKCETVHAG
jgi:Ca2+-binding RTX toxin-like protein